MEMMRIPSVRLVFDRKHQATEKARGLVQIEIEFKRKRKWLSAGVRLYRDQWNDRLHVVRTADAVEQNELLDRKVSAIRKWLAEHTPFSWEALEAFLSQDEGGADVVTFIEREIASRNDLRPSTKRTQRKLVSVLKAFGGIRRFSGLTPSAILDFDNWLHGRRVRKLDAAGGESFTPMRQQSIYSYHKMFKTYINIAIQRGLAERNPYFGLRFKRGGSEPERFLTDAEFRALERAEMSCGSVARVRDLFVFQCYTGLSYSDLCEFDFARADARGGGYVYTGRRRKTGRPFYFMLLPKAVAILHKYGNRLPVVSNVTMNKWLKRAAHEAGIDKPLASHWARRTAAMMFANHGVRMEVVAKILGHSSTQTTQKFYASITSETVAREMMEAGL